MTTIAEAVGYAFMAICAVTALLWAWEVTIRKVFKRMTDSADLYRIILEYAKSERVQRRRDKTVAGERE